MTLFNRYFWEKVNIGLSSWISRFVKKLLTRFPENLILTLVLLLIILVCSNYLLKQFGILTFFGYIFACIRGIFDILDYPKRAIIWFVGYVLGATIIKIIPSILGSAINGNILVSIISVFVIIYVFISLYRKAENLKAV
jgi:hypothetical protein